MEYDSGVSMILPDSIGLIENDFDDEDTVHEQTNQNEVKKTKLRLFLFFFLSNTFLYLLDC